MQYPFTLKFFLQGLPSEALLAFVSLEGANVVLPTQTLGGNLTSNVSNIHQLSIHIPKLKKRVLFSSSDDIKIIRRNTVIYNFACSLGSYTLAHTFSQETNQLIIQMTTDVKQDFDLLKAIAKRFDTVTSDQTAS